MTSLKLVNLDGEVILNTGSTTIDTVTGVLAMLYSYYSPDSVPYRIVLTPTFTPHISVIPSIKFSEETRSTSIVEATVIRWLAQPLSRFETASHEAILKINSRDDLLQARMNNVAEWLRGFMAAASFLQVDFRNYIVVPPSDSTGKQYGVVGFDMEPFEGPQFYAAEQPYYNRGEGGNTEVFQNEPAGVDYEYTSTGNS